MLQKICKALVTALKHIPIRSWMSIHSTIVKKIVAHIRATADGEYINNLNVLCMFYATILVVMENKDTSPRHHANYKMAKINKHISHWVTGKYWYLWKRSVCESFIN